MKNKSFKEIDTKYICKGCGCNKLLYGCFCEDYRDGKCEYHDKKLCDCKNGNCMYLNPPL